MDRFSGIGNTCKVCGGPRKENHMGIELHWQGYAFSGSARCPMCSECAKTIIPLILRSLNVLKEGDWPRRDI